jgi:hypothetical protein
MMPADTKLEQLLGQVFDGARESLRETLNPQDYETMRHDFIFHFTDWKDELEQLFDLFKNPGQQNEAAASVLVIGFLYHVVPHLNAAARLLLDEIGDPFAPKANEPKREVGSRLSAVGGPGHRQVAKRGRRPSRPPRVGDTED